MGFGDESIVAVEQVTDKEWAVLRAYAYDNHVVSPGLLTDFASVPRPLTWLLPRYGRYTKAAIVHDLLWRVEVPAGRLSRRDADTLFRTMLLELDVAFWRRWAMWGAVRLGSLVHKDGRKGWWKDAPRVLAVAAVLVPIIALPVVAILLALTAFFLVEAVTWPFLKLWRKRVNTPSLLIKQ